MGGKNKNNPPPKKSFISKKPISIPVAPTDWQCMYGCGSTFWSPDGASKHEKSCANNPANQE